jgi:signal transduction histidine kinase
MKKKSYSKRIALNFMATTAVLTIVIFTSIYLVVHNTVYSHMDENLDTECHEVSEGIVIFNNRFVYTDPAEWSEKEHAQIEVNPIFIQVSDTLGRVLKRSPNLMGTTLELLKNENRKIFFNSVLITGKVRQVQMVLKNKSNIKAGYISIAVPLEESQLVLNNLLMILLFAFPVVILVLYVVIRYLAQKSIVPVTTLTDSAAKINRENLNERIPLPQREDELYTLTGTINNLLDRIEDTIMREKQFSSDASHELRTPLSVLKGTLELMVRKPRNIDYYIEKTGTCLEEVNRMSVLVDQLLLLSRYEQNIDHFELTSVNLKEMMLAIIARHANSLEQKGIVLDLNVQTELSIRTNTFMMEQILENLFSNAVKYSHMNGPIGIFSATNNGRLTLTIQDEGIGMSNAELSRIFNRFYRADESRNFQIKGYGLGLAITKRFADLLRIAIRVESRLQAGTSFTLFFPDNPTPEKVR